MTTSREVGSASSVATARTLTSLRRRRGLTVTASARFVGVSRWSIRAWEDRRTVPPLWAVRRLATLYGDFGVVLATLRAWTGVTHRDHA